MGARILIAILAAAALAPSMDPAADVDRKLLLIETRKVPRGATVTFPVADLNAWVRAQARELVPEGLREPKLKLANGSATATALVDFIKLRHSAGVDTNWLLSKLIEGEKPVLVVAKLRCSQGQATVHPLRVEIGGLAVTGATLDFLIETFLLPLFPNAKVDKPFALADGVDRIDITPGAAWVYMKK